MNKLNVYILLFCTLFCITNFIYCNPFQPTPLNVFLDRHSGKSYDPNRQISLDKMRSMMEAARWAPSSHNDQPWYFIFCDKELTPKAYSKAFNTLKSTQQAWINNAPLLILIISRTKETYNGKDNFWAEYDTGSAAISMALEATNLGLMAHQVGGGDKLLLAKEFELPENHKVMALMVVGYELSIADDPNAKPRTRRALNETFFLGSWETSFPFVEGK